MALAVAAEYTGLDLALVRPFYDPETQTFPLKDDFFVAGVMHSFGRDVVVYVMSAILLVFAGSFAVSRLRAYRKGAGYMLLAGLTGPAIVSVLKSSTHIYSPWDLALFGSERPYIRLFDRVPPGSPIGHAFPGGHSSGGFAFLTLYFLLGHYRPQYRYVGLGIGLLVGGAFGLAQEVRGAHFLSHDLFSAAICWCVALAVFRLMFRKEMRDSALAAG